MLGYGKRCESALEALGVEVKYPKLMEDGKNGPGDKAKDDLDPMDPSSYSDAPQGGWSRGMPKHGATPGASGGGRMPEPHPKAANTERFWPDSKAANAERF